MIGPQTNHSPLASRLRKLVRPWFFTACGVLTVCLTGCGESRERAADPSQQAPGGDGQTAEPAGGANTTNAASLPVVNVGNRGTASSNADATAAHAMLRRVIARYRSARTYRDSAVVRLRYAAGDTRHEETVPLAVRYAAPDRLEMEAYGARVEWDRGTLRAFVDSPILNRLDRQLLVLHFKDRRIDATKLYRDPVLASFATEGPGGPSPQVELLFGENPLAGFFAEETRLELGEAGKVDGHRCRSVRVTAGDARYVLWIDQDRDLIRRIELPPVALTHMLDGSEADARNGNAAGQAAIELSIAFLGAEIDGPATRWESDLPRRGVIAVDTLTLPPPPLASPLLGRKPEPFHLRCKSGSSTGRSFDVSERGSDRDYTVLLWAANHSGSELAVDQLADFVEQLAADVRRQCRFVVVRAEHAADSAGDSSEASGMLCWTSDAEAIGRDRFGIEQAPALCVMGRRGVVHWLQSPVGPEMTATLDGLLGDLRAGVDVGGRLREQYESDVATYRRLLDDRRQRP